MREASCQFHYCTSMNPCKEIISTSLTVPVSLAAAWEAACHPSRLVPDVPMLKCFHAPRNISEGSAVSETHTILGWPQKFEGHITAMEPLSLWSMSSRPVSWGPASLPHDVEYRFSDHELGTLLSVTCAYWRCGLLRLPFVKGIVRLFMRKVLVSMLKTISSRAQAHSQQ